MPKSKNVLTVLIAYIKGSLASESLAYYHYDIQQNNERCKLKKLYQNIILPLTSG